MTAVHSDADDEGQALDREPRHRRGDDARAADAPRVLTSPSERAAATEDNLVAFFADMSILDGFERTERDGVTAHCAWPLNPMFAGVVGNRLSDDRADAIIDDLVGWLDARRAPYQFWWMNETAEPGDLGARLRARGFELNFDDDPAMIGDLAQVPDILIPAGCVIERCLDQRTLLAWRQAFWESYDLPAHFAQAWVDVALAVGPERTPWRLYVATLDGVPAGTSMLYCGAGVAGLFAIGTVPPARGRGIGAALTLTPMQEARGLGYHHAVLFASPMGRPVYERLGFQDTGRRIVRYMRTMR